MRIWMAVWLAMALQLPLCAAADVDFRLDVKLDAAGEQPVLMVTMEMPPEFFLYAESFRVMDEESQELLALNPLPSQIKQDPFSGEPVQVLKESFRAEYPVRFNGRGMIEGTITYQGCNESTCFMPQRSPFRFLCEGVVDASSGADSAGEEVMEAAAGALPAWEREAAVFRMVDSVTGYITAKPFVEFLEQVGEEGPNQALGNRRTWVAVLLILLGGLALNLTPCVLPMLPVNLAIIGAGAQAGSRRRGFVLGGAYGLGIALAYGGTGLLVVLTGATFGGLNANAWFNGVIALLFLVLALGMFDVIHIDLARFQRSGPSVRRGGLLMALSMGMVSALLAGACVAPVVISVLIWSGQLYAEGHYSGLLLPFVLGAGMALPWPFAGAGLSLLPRPGGWMIWVRNGFGVLILLLALYYGYQAYHLSGFRFSNDGEEAGHEMLTPEQVNERLAMHLRAASERGHPVLLDFGASWCKNCKTMERTTLRDPEVVQALESYDFIYYAAENPDHPETKAVLTHFDVLGLPTYLLLEPRRNGVR